MSDGPITDGGEARCCAACGAPAVLMPLSYSRGYFVLLCGHKGTMTVAKTGGDR